MSNKDIDDEDDFLKWKENNKSKFTRNKIRVVPAGGKKRKKRFVRKDRLKKKIFVYSKQREVDFMKYSFLVEYWAMAQFDLTRDEIGILFYFYSEPYFTKESFISDAALVTGRASRTFYKFIERGILEEIPRTDFRTGTKVSNKKIYKLSFKTLNRIKSLYNRILLHTKISESNKKSNVFRTQKSTPKQKRVAKLIIKMNEDIDKIKNGETPHIDEDFIEFI